jgi:hypothetical protein
VAPDLDATCRDCVIKLPIAKHSRGFHQKSGRAACRKAQRPSPLVGNFRQEPVRNYEAMSLLDFAHREVSLPTKAGTDLLVRPGRA